MARLLIEIWRKASGKRAVAQSVLMFCGCIASSSLFSTTTTEFTFNNVAYQQSRFHRRFADGVDQNGLL
jgi:hypothetical protein